MATAAAATLTYMSTEHVPVLASELVALADPKPGEVAVDCTFGAGGHARLVAERLGRDGELIAIDRDPSAEERFAEFAREAPCRTRFIRGDFADALTALGAQGVRADLVYMEIWISSLHRDACEAGF